MPQAKDCLIEHIKGITCSKLMNVCIYEGTCREKEEEEEEEEEEGEEETRRRRMRRRERRGGRGGGAWMPDVVTLENVLCSFWMCVSLNHIRR